MECGSCTLCCKLLYIKSTDSHVGKWCKYCDQKRGCKVQGEKPEECETFECAWLRMKEVNPALRPDRSKIVWDAVNDHIMFGVQDPHYPLKDIVVNQVKEFVRSGSSVVIHILGQKPQIAVAKGHTHQQVWRETVEKYKEHLNDSA